MMKFRLTQPAAKATLMIAAAVAAHGAVHAQQYHGVGATPRATVETGTVVQAQISATQDAQPHNNTTGTVAGGAIGALAGRQITGKNSSSGTKLLAALAGGAAGAYAGNRLSENMHASAQVQEVIVQLPNGRKTLVAQPYAGDVYQPGEVVQVIQQGGKTRLMRAQGVAQSHPQVGWNAPQTWNGQQQQQWASQQTAPTRIQQAADMDREPAGDAIGISPGYQYNPRH
jgi:outer membrane lipoprotein SlyB